MMKNEEIAKKKKRRRKVFILFSLSDIINIRRLLRITLIDYRLIIERRDSTHSLCLLLL